MTRLAVIGVDPGPTPGIVLLWPHRAPDVVQCSAGALCTVVVAMLEETDESLLAVEEFVVGARAARSSSASAGTRTRDVIGALARLAEDQNVPIRRYRAADVKPWATDRRLAAAGLVEATKGMRHARDAARHALYAAVRDGGHPDPLSTRAAGSPAASARSDRSPTRKGPRS
ncbi:hypothetical protein [Pseudonocardia sp. McavD-2-B]|uniref:hypothetical protein n=1 Tax=Pseudonocardia sp. McavD-2-B TaxID=2954499 RepID=UPI00209722B7|nr:hypothetical protein [Pseudonocardia sp. McavD-2-B]MCO7195041.1 hypothetical protein [Pseudonocardia sp. McavD-2-B]